MTFSKLHTAVRGDDLLEIQKILQTTYANVNERNQNLQTPLHVACEKGNYDIAEYVISKNVDVNIEDCYQNMALHYAMRSQNLKLVRYLLKIQKQDVNKRNKLGELMLEYFMKITYNETRESYPELYQEVVELVIGKMNNLADLNPKSDSLLHIAVQRNDLVVLTSLLQFASASTSDLHSFVNLRNLVSGETAIFTAIRNNNTEMVELLLQNGAKLKVRSKKDQTPLDLLSPSSSPELSDLLKRYYGNEPNPLKLSSPSSRKKSKIEKSAFKCIRPSPPPALVPVFNSLIQIHCSDDDNRRRHHHDDDDDDSGDDGERSEGEDEKNEEEDEDDCYTDSMINISEHHISPKSVSPNLQSPKIASSENSTTIIKHLNRNNNNNNYHKINQHPQNSHSFDIKNVNGGGGGGGERMNNEITQHANFLEKRFEINERIEELERNSLTLGIHTAITSNNMSLVPDFFQFTYDQLMQYSTYIESQLRIADSYLSKHSPSSPPNNNNNMNFNDYNNMNINNMNMNNNNNNNMYNNMNNNNNACAHSIICKHCGNQTSGYILPCFICRENSK